MPAITIQSIELRQSQKEIIAEKFASLLSDLTKVPKDRIYVFFDGYTLENVTKTLSTYLSKTVNMDTIVSKIGATLTDVSSYLGLIGKLAGGVAMFADSLSPLTGQFIKKYIPTKD